LVFSGLLAKFRNIILPEMRKLDSYSAIYPIVLIGEADLRVEYRAT
jgi:hypothetical protein